MGAESSDRIRQLERPLKQARRHVDIYKEQVAENSARPAENLHLADYPEIGPRLCQDKYTIRARKFVDILSWQT